MKKKSGRKPLVLVLLLVFVGLIIAGGLFLANKKPASSPFPTPENQPVTPPPSDWKDYHSDELGFSLKTPVDWLVEEKTTADGREISVVHPGKLAFVRIVGHIEPSLKEVGALDIALKDREDGLRENPRITLGEFVGKNVGEYSAYMATGEEIINDQTWQFIERGVFGNTGKIILMHGASPASLAEKNFPILNQIMDSFNPG